jgi:hypothetical protein
MKNILSVDSGSWQVWGLSFQSGEFSVWDGTGKNLSFSMLTNIITGQSHTGVGLNIAFGGPKSAGYIFYVKWRDSSLPVREGAQLRFEWNWTNGFGTRYIANLWLPAGYKLASLQTAANYTLSTGSGTYIIITGQETTNANFDVTLMAEPAS